MPLNMECQYSQISLRLETHHNLSKAATSETLRAKKEWHDMAQGGILKAVHKQSQLLFRTEGTQ